MGKYIFLIAFIFAGLFYFAGVMASDEAGEGGNKQELSSEEVVAMCEDKFNSANYPDENERNNLIDACINESTDKIVPSAEQG